MAMRFIKRQEEIQGEPPGSADVQSPTPTGRLHRHEKAYEGQSENTKTSLFENFPGWMVVVCNAVGLAVYTIGLYLMIRLGVVWGVLYAVYCLWVEGRVLSRSCRFCYYFGKRCAFGKGKVSSWFLTQGDSETFCTKQVSWRDVAPDFLVSLIPLGVGIFLLVRGFSWLVLLLIVALVGLGSVGTGLVRGNLACKHCKQRELGCPAQKLFSKTEHD
jgi:hypothetical protein